MTVFILQTPKSVNNTAKLRLEILTKTIIDGNMRQRMQIGRPAERYKFLKQNYLLSTPANKPNLEALKAQLRDIDADYRKPQGGAKSKSRQGQRSETEANWGQSSTSRGDRQRRTRWQQQ